MTRRLPARWREDDRGSVTGFIVTFVVGLLVLAGLALDGGLTLAASVRANGQAEAAARAGAQAIDLAAYREHGTLRLVEPEAAAAAHDYLDTVGANGTVTVTDNTVTVTVTGSQPTQLLGLIGIAALDVHGSSSARPDNGATAPAP
jgi:hypothetical protein